MQKGQPKLLRKKRDLKRKRRRSPGEGRGR
jgi:hypothetical protein